MLEKTIGDFRYCPGCDDIHGLEAFGQDSSRGDGLSIYCKKFNQRRMRRVRRERSRIEDFKADYDKGMG